MKVSRILAEHPDGVKEAALMYWPSKQPHCLHRVTVVVDERLDGSVIRLHPDVLETLGGDSDGDLIYLITEPPIVKASRTITEPVTMVEEGAGKTVSFPDMIEMVRAERKAAQVFLEEVRTFIASRQSHTRDAHERMAAVNDASRHIGLAFVARDLIMNAVGYDEDSVYVRMGELCQEALDGLKVTSPADVVRWVLDSVERLSLFLGVPVRDLPYDGDGMPLWHRAGKVLLVYHALSDRRMALSHLVGIAKAAKKDAESLFEWILARTGIDAIERPKVITRTTLREKAESLMPQIPDHLVKAARYHLAKSRAMQVGEDDRYSRVDYLLENGIHPQVLRAVVMERVGQHPDAVEALGLLTALKSIRASEG